MAAADRVDVVLLHQAQIGHELFEADHGPGDGIRIVAVDAPEHDVPVVDLQRGAVDTHRPDAHAVGDDLVIGLDGERVQVRALRAPQVRRGDVEAHPVRVLLVPGGRFERCGGDRGTRGIRDDDRGRRRASEERRADAHARAQWPQCGSREVVEDGRVRALQEIDIADDSARAELVLILEIGADAPLEDEDGEPIRAAHEVVRHVELARRVRDLAVADVAAVQPHVVARIDALEAQEHPRRVRVGCKVEVEDVRPTRVLAGDVRRVERDRVADVRVLMRVVPEVLPGAGHRDVDKVRRDVIGETLRHVAETLEVPERPLPVEHPNPVRTLAIGDERAKRRGGRNVVRAPRQHILVQDLGILVVVRDDHRRRSFAPMRTSARRISVTAATSGNGPGVRTTLQADVGRVTDSTRLI